jgi:hypothetical protein
MAISTITDLPFGAKKVWSEIVDTIFMPATGKTLEILGISMIAGFLIDSQLSVAILMGFKIM